MRTPDHAQVIDDLESRAREHETQAQQCREAASTIRKAYGLSTVAPSAPAPRMRVVKRRHKKATAPVGRRKPGRVQDDAGPADGFSERILAALREFSPGVAKAREIHLEMSAPKDFKRLQKELKVLLSTGRVRREGKASGTKWGLPTSTAAAKDDADAPTRIQEHDIRRAVLELLSSGASYDLTAIHRNASRQFTSLTLRALTPIVEALRKENKIELIPGLTGPGSERYCKRAA